MTIDEGVIKFRHVFIAKSDALSSDEYKELESARRFLFEKKLIGIYDNGIGYGNLSCRTDYSKLYSSKKPQFLISGTQTGGEKELSGKHYTRVVNYNLSSNQVEVVGPIKASSESLTHAAIYECSPKINCVIHIHNKEMWERLLQKKYPIIPKSISYGTQEMAEYSKGLVLAGSTYQLLVMEGHDEGVIFYAETIAECLKNTLKIYQEFC